MSLGKPVGVVEGSAERWPLEFVLNGKPVRVDVPPFMTLLEVLRMELGLTGTKGACHEGECGSCTVMVDGKPMNACLMLGPQVQGRHVVSVEGLADKDGNLHILQRKFIEAGAVQCGYCTPGLLMAAKDILDSQPDCTEEDFVRAMEGNICRCTGYTKIFEAVRSAWQDFSKR